MANTRIPTHSLWFRAIILGALFIGLAPNANAQPVDRNTLARMVQKIKDAESLVSSRVDQVFGDQPYATVMRGLYSWYDGPGDSEADHWAPILGDDHTAPLAIVLVHGLDEPGGVWDDLAPALAAHDLSVIRFDYPNDQPIADSACEFAEALQDLYRRGTRRVAIVGHSMGGLVARDVLTRPGLYGGTASRVDGYPDVTRLITLGTPHGGSALAKLQRVTEMRERVVRWWNSPNRNVREFARNESDGQGGAAIDLLPGSDFLLELNSRALPRGEVDGETPFPITVVVGRVVEPADLGIDGALVDSKFTRAVLGQRVASRLYWGVNDLLIHVGDGVVPETSQRLPGVEDTVIVNATHRGMVRRWKASDPPPPALEIILERLGRPK